VITSVTAKTYAAVLRDIGSSRGTLDTFAEELSSFNGIVRDEKEFAVFLTVPGIDKESKKKLVIDAFSGKMSGDFISFVCVLIDKGRQDELEAIESEFLAMLDEVKNSIRVNVATSTPLDPATRDKVVKTLSAKYGKNIIIEESVDPGLIGGIVVRAGDTYIDGSVATRLRKIKERLLLTRIKGEAVYEN
jgi:F-type H+-transporting ATPase subunit delta